MRPLRTSLVAALAVASLTLPSAYSAGALVGPAPPPADATGRDFNPQNFSSDSFKIDNIWLPLSPGTQFVMQGQANRGAGLLPHQVIFTVTDLTKVINGVRSLVIWDRDIGPDGVVQEAELAFNAQDKAGNVWNTAEYPEEYDAGTFIGAPSTWIAGLGGANAGVAMRARPRVGTSSWTQGFIPAIGFEDQATVVKHNQTACTALVCFGNVLVVDETNLLSPTDGHQLKYHAPLVGIVRIAPGVGQTGQETLDLVKLRHLGPAEMATARREALKLESRAYRVSSVYRPTPPMERIVR
jgi:hypothetical protein